MHVPTIADVDHEPRASFGALTILAMKYNSTAAHNIRTVKNDRGPALFVLYRATTKPVLHSATKIHGASRSNNVPLLLMQG